LALKPVSRDYSFQIPKLRYEVELSSLFNPGEQFWGESKMAKLATVSKQSERPNATDALEAIINTTLPFRTEQSPTLDLLARLGAQGVRLLKLSAEEAAAAQNAAVLRLMKKHQIAGF
jgi:hypothetical protein